MAAKSPLMNISTLSNSKLGDVSVTESEFVMSLPKVRVVQPPRRVVSIVVTFLGSNGPEK